MFVIGDVVEHKKSGKLGEILGVPNDSDLLESTGNAFYIYRELGLRIRWFRDRFEMEDGRFTKIGG
jgi:hypothetical protein